MLPLQPLCNSANGEIAHAALSKSEKVDISFASTKLQPWHWFELSRWKEGSGRAGQRRQQQHQRHQRQQLRGQRRPHLLREQEEEGESDANRRKNFCLCFLCHALPWLSYTMMQLLLMLELLLQTCTVESAYNDTLGTGWNCHYPGTISFRGPRWQCQFIACMC